MHSTLNTHTHTILILCTNMKHTEPTNSNSSHSKLSTVMGWMATQHKTSTEGCCTCHTTLQIYIFWMPPCIEPRPLYTSEDGSPPLSVHTREHGLLGFSLPLGLSLSRACVVDEPYAKQPSRSGPPLPRVSQEGTLWEKDNSSTSCMKLVGLITVGFYPPMLESRAKS